MRAIVMAGALFLAVLLSPLEGRAEETPATPGGVAVPLPVPADALPATELNALVSFVAGHPDCTGFFDGCQICRKQEGGSLACSTPGIACQKQAWRCQEPGMPTAVPLPAPVEVK